MAPRNFATELIALAWAGPPLAEFAVAMSAATDNQLLALQQQEGSLLRAPFLKRAVNLQHLAWEIRAPLKEFVGRQGGANLDLSAICDEANYRFRDLIGGDYSSY
jgi:hypothetical protein